MFPCCCERVWPGQSPAAFFISERQTHENVWTQFYRHFIEFGSENWFIGAEGDCGTCSGNQFFSSTEDELKEKLHLEQVAVQRQSDVIYNSTIHINNVCKTEVLRTECCPAPTPPSLPPDSKPIAVISIPVVTPNPAGSPTLHLATLSPSAAPPLASPKREPHSPQEESAVGLLSPSQPKPEHLTPVLTTSHKQPIQNHHHPQLIAPTNNTNLQQQLVQRYPGSIVSPPQQHALLPQLGPVLQQAPLQNGSISRGSPPDDGRLLDNKKRPGG